MSKKTQDICDTYAFHFLEDVVTPAVKLISVGREKRFSGRYHHDSRNRKRGYLLQYTLSGTGTLETRFGKQIIRPGQIFFLKFPEEESYYFDEEENQAPWELLYVLFEGEAMASYHDYFLQNYGKVAELVGHHPAVQAMAELYRKAREGQINNAFEAGKMVFELVSLLCGTSAREQKSYSSLVKRSIKYMREHYTGEMSIAQMADRLKVSPSHLSREFLKETGEQPIHFLTKLRLQKAISLLNTTDDVLWEISGACGFSDSNYFSKVFRRYMKVSPGEFRKQIQTQEYVNIQI